MKNLSLLILFLLLFGTVGKNNFCAQNKIIDSIFKELRSAKEDTFKVRLLNGLAGRRGSENPDTGIILAKQSIELALKLNYKQGLGVGYSRLGNFFMLKSDHVNSIKYYFKALEIWQEKELKALPDDKLEFLKLIAREFNGIGACYLNMGNNDKAMEYYTKCLELNEKAKDKKGIASAYNNIAELYVIQNKRELAKDYYKKALSINEEIGNLAWVAVNLANLGALYEGEKNYEKGLEVYSRALKINEEFGSKYNIAMNLCNMGILYHKMNKNNEAEKYAIKSLQMSEEIGDIAGVKFANDFLFEIYKTTGKFELAIKHLSASIKAKDSIFSMQKNDELVRVEMQHEFQVQKAMLKAEQEKKDAITQQESIRQKMILGFVISVLVLVFVAAALIFRSLKTTRKQKLLIEEKNKEILDSIHYAKRIQQSLLPTEKYIDKKLRS